MPAHRKNFLTDFVCETCGVTFKRLNGHAYRFCSAKCRAVKLAETDTKISHICEWCGKEFRSFPSRTGRFCSKKCASAFGCRQPKPNARRPETMHVERLCKTCGNPYFTNVHQIKSRGSNFCSLECKYIWQSKRLQETGGPNFKGGISYTAKSARGKNWASQKRQVKIRDGGACVICGSVKNIDTHHIKAYEDFCGNWKAANDLNNLISLCRVHHRMVESHKIILFTVRV